MRRAVGLLSAVTLALAGGVSAAAAPPDACLFPATDLDMTLAGLERDGWTALPDGTLTPDVANLLVWPYLLHYLGADTGGADLASLVPLQMKTVQALARKRDIPTSKTRLMQREGAALAVFWRAPSPGTLQLQCRVAVIDPDAPVPAQPIVQAPRTALDGGFAQVTHLDAAALAAQHAAPVPTTVLETYLTFPGEVAQ